MFVDKIDDWSVINNCDLQLTIHVGDCFRGSAIEVLLECVLQSFEVIETCHVGVDVNSRFWEVVDGISESEIVKAVRKYHGFGPGDLDVSESWLLLDLSGIFCRNQSSIKGIRRLSGSILFDQFIQLGFNLWICWLDIASGIGSGIQEKHLIFIRICEGYDWVTVCNLNEQIIIGYSMSLHRRP